MIDIKNILVLLEEQAQRNESQQEIIRSQNKALRTYEEQNQLLKELIRTIVEENNIFREQFGMEKEDFSDFGF